MHVRDLDSLPGVVERTIEESGRLDTLVHDADGEVTPPFLETRVDHIADAIHLDVVVPFEESRLAGPHRGTAKLPLRRTLVRWLDSQVRSPAHVLDARGS